MRLSARAKTRTLAIAGALVLVAGLVGAIRLPPGQGTCGLPPAGLDEFCRGNDYRLNEALLLGSLGVATALLALALDRKMSLRLASALMLIGAGAAAFLIPARPVCPPGELVQYGLTVDSSPVCAPYGAQAGNPPVIDNRFLFRILVSGGAVVGVYLLGKAWPAQVDS